MSQLAAGWYVDPWRQAPLRWFTGDDWTGATTDAPGWYFDPWQAAPLRWFDGNLWTPTTNVQPEQPSVGDSSSDVETTRAAHTIAATDAALGTGGLQRLVGSGKLLAVVDVETTGFGQADRIVEIAIVTLDATGAVRDEFETLVNPLRDIGASKIHGVSASMVANAPTFAEISTAIAARLDDVVVVAHNLPFDTRMVGYELTHSGIGVDWGAGLDTHAVTRSKLEVACSEYRISIGEAHRALADARATAQLLVNVADRFTAPAIPATTGIRSSGPVRLVTRDSDTALVDPPAHLLADDHQTESGVAGYLKLLKQAVADLKLTDDERIELQGVATELGLSERDVAAAHRELLHRLVDEAVDDHVVTDDELDQLLRVAVLLDIDPESVATRTNHYRFVDDTMTLAEGLTVCFTGEAEATTTAMSRDRLRELAIARGLEPVSTVTAKGCRLLVAADVATHSGKAKSAHKFGLPIAGVDDFVAAVTTGGPLSVRILERGGVASVCEQCGDSWTSSRRGRRCNPCRTGKVSKIQLLTCIDCSQVWQLPHQRGRRPDRCDECVTAAG